MKKILFLLLVMLSVFQHPAAFAQLQGRALIDSLLAILPAAKEDTNKVNILNKVCAGYYAINPEEAIKYGEKALTLAQSLQWKKGIALAYNNLGVNYWAKSDYPKALEYYISSLKINEESGSKTEIARNYGNIGLIYWNQAEYSKAKEYYFKALKINEEAENKTGMAYNYGNIGLVYGDEKDYPKALEYDFKALKLFEESGDKSGMARNLGNIGVVYTNQLDYSKGLEYYFKALKLCEELGNKSGMAKNLGNIGERYLDIVSENNRDLLNKLFDGNKTKALKQAKLYLDSAAAIKKEIGDYNSLKLTFLDLSRTEELLGEDKMALDYYKKYSAAKDSVFNSENEKKITTLQMQYEFDKKEASVKAEQEKQKLVRNYIYSALGIVVVFLMVLLVQRNKIAKERRIIELEQERMRISRDLHDDLGSGLTGVLMLSEQLQASSAKELITGNIEKIKQSSRQMVDQMGEIVWAMNAKNDTLENLLAYLDTYTRDYFENTTISQQIVLPGTIPHTVMTGMTRRNIFLVLKESLNNITKHACATEVILDIKMNGNSMNIVLTDNGKGFEPNQTRRFGNGLKNMQSRMADIKGNFSIESNNGKGTKTVISFPLA